MSKFKVGDKVRFIGRKSGECVPSYDTNGDHIVHGNRTIGESYENEGAVIVCHYREFMAVKYISNSGKFVCLNFREEHLELFIPSNELKNNKMDINEVKTFDKAVLKNAKANVLKARKQMQTEQAEAVLMELLNTKDAIEDRIGEGQEILDSVTEDIKVFDVKR